MALQDCTLNLNRTRRELQPHGTPGLPCTGYSSTYIGSAGGAVPWHWHEDLEIICAKPEHLKLQVPGKTPYLKQGEDTVVNSNILYFATAGPLCELHPLVFHPLLVVGEKDSVFSRKYVTPFPQYRSLDICPFDHLAGDLRAGNPAAVFAAALDAFCNEPLGYGLTAHERLSCIRRCLYIYYPRAMDSSKSMPNADNIRIRKIVDFIHGHSRGNLDLTQIARAADIGECRCLRYFRCAIQTSPLQYLLKCRTARGVSMLLRNPHSSVSSIAGMYGFNSPSNFSQMFVRSFKCTPGEYGKVSYPSSIFP